MMASTSRFSLVNECMENMSNKKNDLLFNNNLYIALNNVFVDNIS